MQFFPAYSAQQMPTQENMNSYTASGLHDSMHHPNEYDQNYNSYAHQHNDDSSELLSDETSSEVPWITWFCSLPEHEFFIEVPEEYIEDGFNLVGLNTIVPHYEDALDMILDLEAEEDDDLDDDDRDQEEKDVPSSASGVEHKMDRQANMQDYNSANHDQHNLGSAKAVSSATGVAGSTAGNNLSLASVPAGVNGSNLGSSRSNSNKSVSHMRMVESSAEMLYGLIHARYLMTKSGLQSMAERYQHRDFGQCPRAGCGGCGLVPCGRSDSPGYDTVKMYCPRCNDLYHPKKIRFQAIDGAYFGTAFASLLFLTYPNLVPRVFSYSGDGRRTDKRNPERDVLERARAKPLGDNTNHDVFDDDDDDSSEESESDQNEDDMDEEADGAQGLSKEQQAQKQRERNVLPDYWLYQPRIFGFRISEKSSVGPHMGWLRWKDGLPEPNTRIRGGGSSRSRLDESRSGRSGASQSAQRGRGSADSDGMPLVMVGPAGMLGRLGSLDETEMPDDEEGAGDDGSVERSAAMQGSGSARVAPSAHSSKRI